MVTQHVGALTIGIRQREATGNVLGIVRVEDQEFLEPADQLGVTLPLVQQIAQGQQPVTEHGGIGRDVLIFEQPSQQRLGQRPAVLA